MEPSSKSSGNAAVPTTSTINSFEIRVPSVFGGAISAVNPRINPMFVMFDPTTFPSAIGLLPSAAANMLTASSGADVAYDTTVNPITKGRTPSLTANPAAPRTNHSAP